MAITKTTTPTNALALGLSAFACVLGLLALVNFFAGTSLADRNKTVETDMLAAVKLPFSQRIIALDKLRNTQEKLLAKGPSEPFGWGRLSYFRSAVQNDPKGAQAALRMSDLVSPYDPFQIPTRALMWHNLRATQTDEEKAYLATLWQKGALMDNKGTWQVALDNKLIKEVEQALQSGGDPQIAKAWIELEKYTGHFD